MSYEYKNIISAFNHWVKFHDDQIDNEEVEILSFPFDHIFGDFRIFNGIPICEVDEFVGKLRQIMIDIMNRHKEIKREKLLEEDSHK